MSVLAKEVAQTTFFIMVNLPAVSVVAFYLFWVKAPLGSAQGCTAKCKYRFLMKMNDSRAKPEIYFTTEQISAVLTRFCRKSPSFGHSYRTRNILQEKPQFWSFLQNQQYLTRFCRKSPSFGHSYRTSNILTRFCRKSPSFGHSYRTSNILTIFCRKSPSVGHSPSLERFGDLKKESHFLKKSHLQSLICLQQNCKRFSICPSSIAKTGVS